jgi:hypothetical protein
VKKEILTTIIAVYGAVLSTIAIVRQLVSDRAKIKLTVRRNQQIMGDPRYGEQILVMFRVTNVGRRPVTITTFGAIGLYPQKNLVTVDSQPQLPHEISEGQYITSFWPQAGLDFSTIDYWAAWDSHDRVYKLKQASWFRHMKSNFQLTRSFRKDRKAKLTAKAPQ